MKHRKRQKKFRPLDRRTAISKFFGDADEKAEKRTKLYFGYGSNLDIRQMKRRCKDSVPVVAGKLPGYLLSFSGVLTIETHDTADVVGGIYEVSPADERHLDRYEGFPHMYSKRYTHMTIGGERRTVFYYVLNQPYTLGPPMSYYFDIVAQGYRDWKLDSTLLKAARKRAFKAERSAIKKYYELDKRKWKDYSYKSYEPVYTVDTDGTVSYPEWASTFDNDWAEKIGTKDDSRWVDPVDAPKDPSLEEMAASFDQDYARQRGW